MKLLAFVFAAASAQTLTDCNPDSIAKIKRLEIVPDPPQAGKDATIYFTANFPTMENSMRYTVDVSAGPIDIKALTFDFNLTQKVLATDQDVTAVMGPFTWPNLNIPLIPKLRGKVQVEAIGTAESSPVCVEFAIKLLHDPNLPTTLGDAPFSSCLDTTDEPHFKFIDTDLQPPAPKKGDSITGRFSGILDEDVDEMMVDMNIDISIIKLPLKIPVKISPSMATLLPEVTSSGMEAVIGPIKLLNIPLIPNVKGTVKITDKFDGTGEIVQCINFNMPVMSESMLSV